MNPSSGFCLAVMLCALLGCEPGSEGQATVAPASSAETAPVLSELPERVVVAPELITKGVISLALAEATSMDAQGTIYGEIVPGPTGLAEVGSLVAGRVAEVLVAEGARVKKGQPLAWLDSPEVGLLRAEVRRQKTQVELATQRVERQRELAKQQATSESLVQQAEAELKMAHAELDASLVRLRAVAGDGGSADGRVALRSPIEGVITERGVVLGRAVTPNQTLFVVTAPGNMMVEARFPETTAALPTSGDSYVVRVRSSRSAQTGACLAKVQNDLLHVDPATRTTVVRLTPAPNCPAWLPGEFVQLSLDQKAAETDEPSSHVRVPTFAVTLLRDQPSVFVAEAEPGHFRVRSVTPVRSSGGTTVLSGIKPGEKVVTKGALLLKGEVLKEVLGGE